MGGDERVELADELAVASETEERIDPVLRGGEPELSEPVDLGLREVVVRELGERGPPPQRERLVEHARRLVRRSVIERTPSVTGEPLEARRVDDRRPSARST